MWIELVLAIISFVTLIIKEYLSGAAEAKKENKEFKLSQETFQKAVDTALQKQLLTMAKASKGAGNAWDAADGKSETGKSN